MLYCTAVYSKNLNSLSKKSGRRINTAEMWIYSKVHYISWRMKKTNGQVLEQLPVQHELLKEI